MSTNLTQRQKDERIDILSKSILVGSLVFLLFGNKKITMIVLIIGLIVIFFISQENVEGSAEGFVNRSHPSFPLRQSVASSLRETTGLINIPGEEQIVSEVINRNDLYRGAPSSGGQAPLDTCHITYRPSLVPGNMVTCKNQVLVGPVNPKTLIPPPISPPLSDLDHWKASNWTVHSHINSRPVQISDEYESAVCTKMGSKPSPGVNWLSGFENSNTEPCFKRFCSKNTIEPFVRFSEPEPCNHNSINQLQPNIFVSSINQPILSNAGLLSDYPQPQTTLFTGMVNPEGQPKTFQLYVETPPSDSIRENKNSYGTLETAYNMPERHVRDCLPRRYGDFHCRTGFNNSCSNAGFKTMMTRDLSGAEEMSEYFNRNKLDMFDVSTNAPLYDINRSAVEMHLEVKNRRVADLQESLMRKINAEAWQKKEFPLDTNQRNMTGGYFG